FDFYREQADVKTVPKSYKEIGKTGKIWKEIKKRKNEIPDKLYKKLRDTCIDSYNYLDMKLKLIVATSWKSYTTKYNESKKKDYVMDNIIKNLTEYQDEKIYNSLLHEWEEKSFVIFEEFRNKNMTYKYKDYL
ncbi:4034_t:CDS:2, partial [Dentiscutata erythropus]